MALIHFKNAFDMLLQTYRVECLKKNKISDEVIYFITKAMEN